MPEGIGYNLSDHDRMMGADARRQKEEMGMNPPNWAVNEELWEKAKKAAKGSPAKDKWAVVTHIYKQMGGRVR